MKPKQVLSIYRQILRELKKYPSIRRPQIIAAVKDEFHAGKDETDQNRLIIKWDQARKGLVEIQKYTKLDPKKVVNRISVG